jgi:hypothetical protein
MEFDLRMIAQLVPAGASGIPEQIGSSGGLVARTVFLLLSGLKV